MPATRRSSRPVRSAAGRGASRRAQGEVTALLPVSLAPGGVRYAPGIRAGRWVFATGHKGTADFVSGMAPEVTDEEAPLHGVPRHRKEADRIFANLGHVLEAGGSRRDAVVRIDQYYTAPGVVDPYHDARRAWFAGHVPPSTSNLHQRFLLAGQSMEVQMIAVVPGPGFRPAQHRPSGLPVHATSGYSPVLTCGDYAFVAGQTSEALVTEDGPLDPAARMPAGHLWKGTPIKLETEFVIERKLRPALASVGCTLADVVKSQVYLRDMADVPAFNEVWARHFGRDVPATTVISTATPGFICETGRIEINTIALRPGGTARRTAIDAGVPTVFAGHPQAIRAGDLLFLSGLMAVDERGALAPDVRIDPRQPWFGDAAELQMARILEQAEAICRRAGTSLGNVVRAQQFHTHLGGFHGAWRAWDRRLPSHYLPLSAIEVPALPVPGAVVMLDLWVHVP
ncbi:MAG: RidA family protein [Pseudomonadota bacterium]|jgi:enamine deaminase RidA (YjgF/YER057c/UK114 family)